MLPVIAWVIVGAWVPEVPKYVALKKLACSIPGIKAFWPMQVATNGALLHLRKQLAAGVYPSYTTQLMTVEKTHVAAVNEGVLDVGNILHVQIKQIAHLQLLHPSKLISIALDVVLQTNLVIAFDVKDLCIRKAVTYAERHLRTDSNFVLKRQSARVIGVFTDPMEVHHVTEDNDGVYASRLAVLDRLVDRCNVVVWTVDVSKNKNATISAYYDVALAPLVVGLRNRSCH